RRRAEPTGRAWSLPRYDAHQASAPFASTHASGATAFADGRVAPTRSRAGTGPCGGREYRDFHSTRQTGEGATQNRINYNPAAILMRSPGRGRPSAGPAES